MRQIYFEGNGGPEVIRIGEAGSPRPGPGQVLIEVAAAGVNRPDCMQRAGVYPPPPGESNIPGLEVAGRVAELGAGVSTLKAGEAVCALLGSGGYAEYAVAAEPLCLPIPKALSLIEAAGIPEAFFTVYDNVFTRGRLTAGETLLVHGGSSGIGSTAIQLVKAFGADVVTTAGSDEKCAFCKALGADFAINYKTQDFVAETKTFTGGRGVDVVLDMVAGSYFAKNCRSSRWKGVLCKSPAPRTATSKDSICGLCCGVASPSPVRPCARAPCRRRLKSPRLYAKRSGLCLMKAKSSRSSTQLSRWKRRDGRMN